MVFRISAFPPKADAIADLKVLGRKLSTFLSSRTENPKSIHYNNVATDSYMYRICVLFVLV